MTPVFFMQVLDAKRGLSLSKPTAGLDNVSTGSTRQFDRRLFFAPKTTLKLTLILILFGCLLAACSSAPGGGTATPSLEPTRPLTPEATPSPTVSPPTDTPTPLPPLAIFLSPAQADPALAAELEGLLYTVVTRAGLRWQVRPSLSPDDLPDGLQLVVALPPAPELPALVAAAPQVQFLAVGFGELPAAPNLSTVALQGASAGQQGFIAGFIAALITADTRVAMIGLAENADSQSALIGFSRGITYFCGLCQPNYPPFYDYPYSLELPAGAQSIEWRALADFLLDHSVQTVFIFPGAGDDAMLQYLAEAGVSLIGAKSPPAGLEAHWAATLRSEPLPVIQQLLPELLAGNGGLQPLTPLVIAETNPELLTPGRLRLAEETLSDLLAGFIDSGDE